MGEIDEKVAKMTNNTKSPSKPEISSSKYPCI